MRLAVVVVALVATGLAGCTTGASSPPESPSSRPPASASPSPRPSPAAVPHRPPARGCYALTAEQALMPTAATRPVRCSRPHTAATFFVGPLDTVVDGHLLAVDARRVREQVAQACPTRLPAFLGGSAEQLRLSTLRAVWFSPTLEQSDEGQSWFRCDVVAVGAEGALARLGRPLEGVLASPAGRERYAVCGTAEPGTPRFRRVLCSQPHAWRAIASYDVAGTGPEQRTYPGPEAVRSVAEDRCLEAGREAAADPLSFQWGYDWPTPEQWAVGQRYGLCWAPG